MNLKSVSGLLNVHFRTAACNITQQPLRDDLTLGCATEQTLHYGVVRFQNTCTIANKESGTAHVCYSDFVNS